MTERPLGPDDSPEWLKRAKGNLRLASVMNLDDLTPQQLEFKRIGS
jgi:hypothetical protein